ncbi:MAG TPA: DUF1236 domain-containing protein [Xanthobacteraceae bacterium]|nr:DUF1236 domain-containing protein [Xanthobacteraceae bacterium]
MKKLLLATTAGIALLAGTQLGAAQQSQSGGGAPSASPGAPSGGGAGGSMREGSGSGGQATPGTTGRSGAGSSAQQTQPGGREGRDAAESPRQGSPSTTQRERDRNQGQSTQRERDRNQGQSTQREPSQQREMQQQERSGQNGAGQGRTGRGETTGAAPANVTVNTEQRTKIKQHISELRVGRVDNPNFTVSVGSTVPRSVTLHALPPSIVEIVPAWRSYRYVLVEDEIVIIDPATFRIVAVIEA